MKKTRLLPIIFALSGATLIVSPLVSCTSEPEPQPEVGDEVECISESKRFEITDFSQKAKIRFKFKGNIGTEIKIKVDGSLEHELLPSSFDITVSDDKIFEIYISFKEQPTDLWDEEFSLGFEYEGSDGKAKTQSITGFSIFYNGELPIGDNDINYTGEKSIVVDTLKPELSFNLARPLSQDERLTANITKYNEQSNRNAVIKGTELKTIGTKVTLTLEMDGIVDSGYIAFDLHFSCEGTIDKEIQGFKLIYTKYKSVKTDNKQWLHGNECFITTGDGIYKSLIGVDFTKDTEIDKKTTLPIYANNYQEVCGNLFAGQTVPANIKCLCIFGGDKDTTLYIHKDAFKGWDSLEYVYIRGTNVYFDSETFDSCPNLKTIDITDWDDSKINSASPFSEKDVFIGLPEFGSILTKQQLNSNIYYTFQSSGVPESWFYYDYTQDSDEQFTYVFVPQTNDKILTGLLEKENISDSEELIIPEDVTVIAPGAFKDCFVDGSSSVNTVSVAEGSKLKAIHGTAFEGCTSLTKIDLSNATELSLLGIATFYNCESASEIILPSSLTDIGTWCFYNCSNIQDEDIIANTKIKAITTGSFSGCTKLTKLNLNENLTSIDAIAFQGDTSLESISIPASVVQIEQASFKDCSNLSNVEFASESTLKYLFKEAFANCNIQSIVLPISIIMLEKAVFAGNKNLTQLSMQGGGGFFIGHNNAIYDYDHKLILGCSGTTSYWNAIGSIGPNAFENLSIDNTLLNMKNLFTTRYKDEPTIGEYAFANTLAKDGVTSLDLILPKSPMGGFIIKRGAFYNSAINSLTINSVVSDVEDEAFKDSQLTKIDVTKLSQIPAWQGKEIFGGKEFPEIGQVIYDGSKISEAQIKAFMEGIGLPSTWSYVNQ